MEKFLELFEEFLMKAIVLTEDFIATLTVDSDMELFTSNRDRLLHIIDQIARQIDWNQISEEKKEENNKKIDYLKKLDEKLIVKLHGLQDELKKEIESTVRQKDNIKGYNLTDVKYK